MFYVYQYIDPCTNLPFYIGKGSGDRKFSHLNETFDTTINLRKFYKIESLIKRGLTPVIKEIAQFDIESNAYKLEEKLIDFFGRKGYDPGGILLNISKNSNPPSRKGKKLTNEQKEKMKGRKLTDEQKEKRKGREPWNKGKKALQVAWNKDLKTGPRGPLSEETKNKLREVNLGQKKSEETCKKMSDSMKGRVPWNYGKTGLKGPVQEITFISPEGKEYKYESMKQGCIENNLIYSKMSAVKNNKLKHHRGWTIKR